MVDAAQRVYGLFGEGERCRFVLNPKTGHQPYHISPIGVEWITTHLGATPSWADGSAPPIVTLGEMAQRHGTTIEKLYNVERHHKGAVVHDVNLVHRDIDALRVLPESERREGPYTLPRWLDDLEAAELARTPEPGASKAEIHAWCAGIEARREELSALLGAERYDVSWTAGDAVDLTQLGLVPDTVHDLLPGGTEARIHALRVGSTLGVGETAPDNTKSNADTNVDSSSDQSSGQSWKLPSLHALSLRPPAQRTDGPDRGVAARTGSHAVVYLPLSHDWRTADWRQVGEWLAAGSTVVVLSCAKLYDDELLAGTSATAFNVAMTLAAVDLVTAQLGIQTITCHGEVDDVAAWAGALDDRITRVDVRSRGGVEPSSMGTKRREGVVPRRGRIADHVGLWVLTLPRELDIGEAVAAPHELEQLNWLKGQILQWSEDQSEGIRKERTS